MWTAALAFGVMSGRLLKVSFYFLSAIVIVQSARQLK